MANPRIDPADVAKIVQLNYALSEYWRRIQEAKRMKKEDPEAERALVALVPPGLYEHFKSGEDSQKFYAVSGLGPEVNGNVHPVVKYMALYAPHAGEPVSRVLLEPVDDAFFGPIERQNDKENPYAGRRFRLIQTLSHAKVGLLMDYAKELAEHKTREDFLAAVTLLLD